MKTEFDDSHLVRNAPLKASRLGVLECCPLRYLFEESYSKHLPIPPHPLAILGIEIHHATEVLNFISWKNEGPGFAIEIKNRAAAKLATNPIVLDTCEALPASSNLGQVIEPSILSTRIGAAYRKFTRKSSLNRELASVPNQSDQISPRMFGPEIELESSQLDLKGRADRIDRIGSKIRITELKTGSIKGRDNNLKRDHWLQINAYASMMVERHPNHEIEMCVLGSSGEWSQTFDIEARHSFSAILDKLRKTLPRGKPLELENTARQGTHCKGCRARPNCPTYTEWAPKTWSDDSDIRGQPLDIWGTITKVEVQENGYRALRIKDIIGRSRLVRNVPNLLLDGIKAGDKTAFYNLRTLETGRRGKFPYTFYIVNNGRPYDSAYDVYLCKSLPPVSFGPRE